MTVVLPGWLVRKHGNIRSLGPWLITAGPQGATARFQTAVEPF
jgi:hypothetical protein